MPKGVFPTVAFIKRSIMSSQSSVFKRGVGGAAKKKKRNLEFWKLQSISILHSVIIHKKKKMAGMGGKNWEISCCKKDRSETAHWAKVCNKTRGSGRGALKRGHNRRTHHFLKKKGITGKLQTEPRAKWGSKLEKEKETYG